MQNSFDQITILLVGDYAGGLEKANKAFREAGYAVITASDVTEGFRLARRRRPALIVSEVELEENSGLDLCRMIRADRDLGATPFILVSQAGCSQSVVLTAFRTGADDVLSQNSDMRLLAAKTAWLIERKTSDESLKQYYQILRDRQYQIAGIIKGVSELFADSDFEVRAAGAASSESCCELDKRVSLGINMVGALANLLDEQIKAISIGERSLRGEAFFTTTSAAAAAAGAMPDSSGRRFAEPHPISYEAVID